MRSQLLLLPILFLSLPLVAEEAPASRFFAEDTVEYVLGSLPLVIAAPHGGTLKPDTIPDRRDGVKQRDAETDLLARELARAIAERTGAWPHLVICHLHRAKVDCNRDALTGTGGNRKALATWWAFHEAIGTARAQAKEGLYVDLHGHSHPIARVEIGYLLDAAQLSLRGEDFEALRPLCSVAALADAGAGSFADFIRGPRSLGALLGARGYAAVPSPDAPDPGAGPFFRGGFNTANYGSTKSGRYAAVQLECPKAGVRDTEENRRRFATALAEALIEWLAAHGRPLLPPVPAAGSE